MSQILKKIKSYANNYLYMSDGFSEISGINSLTCEDSVVEFGECFASYWRSKSSIDKSLIVCYNHLIKTKGAIDMKRIECSCSRKFHQAPLEDMFISSGAIGQLPEILKGYKSIYLVADTRTYTVAGELCERVLREAGMFSHKCILKGDIVLPNAETIGSILLNAHDPSAKSDIFSYSPLPDLILAVGSGTINDSCRLASYRLQLPYAVVATAPSMDGYASAGSPILFNGSKATVQATTPKYIIADIDVVREAPMEMMLAGIGDMFGKYTGLLDWELARDYTGEYYCEQIAGEVLDATNKCLENGYKLPQRDPECIRAIIEGLSVTGLGMAYIGNSRPASGAEHIVAHAWELFDVERGNTPHLHGLEVCEATRLVALMFQMLYRESDDLHLKTLIEKYLPYFEAIEAFCRTMKMPPTVSDRETILAGIKRALIMRDRYTVLFYLRDRGMLDDYAERATDALLKVL